MKAGNKKKTETLRLVKSEMLLLEKSPGFSGWTESDRIRVIQKMVSARKDSISQYLEAGRNDLADEEKLELEILSEFIPELPSKEKLTEEIRNHFPEDYKISMKDMKPTLDYLKQKYPGISGKDVSDIIKSMM